MKNLAMAFCLIGLFVHETTPARASTIAPATLGECFWTNDESYPIPVFDNAVTVLGGSVYSFGGASNKTPVANSYKFDGTSWSAIAPLPVALEGAAAVSDGTNIFILGGSDVSGSAAVSVYRYNPLNNTYTTEPSFSTATDFHTAVYLNGKIYKFGGYTNNNAPTNALEIFNISAHFWTVGASYPLALSFVGAFIQQDFIYAAGGTDFVSSGSTKAYRYDPALDAWDDSAIADLPAARWGAAAGTYGEGVLAGGYVGSISASVISWDAPRNTWRNLPDMPSGRARSGGAVLTRTGALYVVGGDSRDTYYGPDFSGTSETEKLVCGSQSGASVLVPGHGGILVPGDSATVALDLQNTGDLGASCTSPALTGTLQSSGGVKNPAPASQNYGALCSGDAAVSRNFTFSIDPNLTCGATLTASLAISDGPTHLGNRTYALSTGVSGTVLSENFDAVVAPALPAGWTATNAQGAAPLWLTSTAFPYTGPNAAYVKDPSALADKYLDTPAIAIVSPLTQLSFRNYYYLSGDYSYAQGQASHGGVLEVSSPNINGGAFTDITDPAVGGNFVKGGYVVTIYGTSPITGRRAWSGNSVGYVDTLVNLGPNVAGHAIKLRFRMASDDSGGTSGWSIDSLTIIAPVCAPNVLVNTLGDHDDGVCDATDCTLREAISKAEAQGGIIGFAPGVTGTIELNSQLPGLSHSMAIEGPGANRLTVRRNAGGAYRIFTINPGTVVSFSGLTIADGDASGEATEVGGGIFNDHAVVTVNNSVVQGNTGYPGGGIYNRGSGGYARLLLANSTLTGNVASGGQSQGGAIYNEGLVGGTVKTTLTNCTVSGNTATNTNTAAILNWGQNGAANTTITNCTFSDNAIYNRYGAVFLANTLLNAGTGGSTLTNESGTIVSRGHNLSSDAAGGFLDGTGDQINTNPKLDPAGLASNGGSTTTIAIFPTSPAINAGDNTQALLKDQRGYTHVGVTDIGAFEYGASDPDIIFANGFQP